MLNVRIHALEIEYLGLQVTLHVARLDMCLTKIDAGKQRYGEPLELD